MGSDGKSSIETHNSTTSLSSLYRYSNYYNENGTQTRDLIKATGIRFVIKVTGQAGKFSIVPLLLNLGSGLGLLAIVSSFTLFTQREPRSTTGLRCGTTLAHLWLGCMLRCTTVIQL